MLLRTQVEGRTGPMRFSTLSRMSSTCRRRSVVWVPRSHTAYRGRPAGRRAFLVAFEMIRPLTTWDVLIMLPPTRRPRSLERRNPSRVSRSSTISGWWQEEPISIYSMATSSAEGSVRNEGVGGTEGAASFHRFVQAAAISEISERQRVRKMHRCSARGDVGQ